MKGKIIVILCLVVTLFLSACQIENVEGEFLTLTDAYEQKLISKENLSSIKDIYTNDLETFPILDYETELKIKETRLTILKSLVNDFGNPIVENPSIDGISEVLYYGNYNNYYAVMIRDAYSHYGTAISIETIDGIEFVYADGNRILIWFEK